MGHKRITYSLIPLSSAIDITLPWSKSIVNRLLILQWLSGEPLLPAQYGEGTDTTILRKLIEQADSSGAEVVLDAGLAGTTSRFILAALAVKQRACVLTGSQRLLDRPIAPLISALNQLGANLQGTNGALPVVVGGSSPLRGREVEVDSSLSSQFLSALLLIAPFLEEGLTLRWSKQPASYSYVKTTLLLLASLGIQYEEGVGSIRIYSGRPDFSKFKPPVDWSSVTGWYHLLACGYDGAFFFYGLSLTGLQADEAVVDLYERLGIETLFSEEGALVRRKQTIGVAEENSYGVAFPEVLDCHSFPDLVPTLAVTLAVMGVRCRLIGLSTLRVKESDRIASLRRELTKAGYRIEEGLDSLLLDGGAFDFGVEREVFRTYEDHRMAIAWTVFAMLAGKIEMDDPEVVRKSYPMWWHDLSRIGFKVLG